MCIHYVTGILGFVLAVQTCAKHHGYLPKNVLVFGGNGFMGAALVGKLIERGDNLTLVNRGNWYWDSGTTIRPLITHVRCDRQMSLHSCTDINRLLHNNKIYFDAVVDFSGYHVRAVIEALTMLKGRIGRYIYISSDSVYEVCLKTHSQPSVETDAVRPHSPEDRNLFNERDDYGHRKLECEEVLDQQRQEVGGVPYVSLRLPDVIGPRDNTNRWWMYQLWLRLSGYLETPVSIPKFLLNRPLSFVYSDDVATAILNLLEYSLDKFDEAYNLACLETPTLMDVLESMKKHLNVSNIPIKINDDTNALYLFPSVKLGPISVHKAQTKIDWKPTSFEEIVSKNVMFYEDAIRNVRFDRPRKDIIRSMQAYFKRVQ